MKNILLLTFCVCLTVCSLSVEPNEQCSWRGYKSCPISSAGSNPVCDATTPSPLRPGVYSIKVCTAETPKFIGGKYDVGVALYGKILTVDVIPTEAGENNENCGSGEESIGSRVFSAHCEVTGPGKIRGLWAITYEHSDSETIVQ